MPLSWFLSLVAVFLLGFVIGRITKRNTTDNSSTYTYLNTIDKPDSKLPKDASLDERLLSLIRAGKKLEAIKLYRSHFNCGLKDAKDAIDAMS